MGMLRFLIRKILLLFVLLGAVVWLKQSTASISETVGRWISGAKEHHITQAFSDMIDSLSQGNGVQDSVEVFCEALQN